MCQRAEDPPTPTRGSLTPQPLLGWSEPARHGTFLPLPKYGGFLMPKKRLSSVDLSWMIFERMREEVGEQRGVTVAVVSDGKLGWRAIIEGRSGRHLSPAVIRKLRSIEDEFRSIYSLADD